MRETKSKTIGDRTFAVQQLPATRGTKLFYRLAAALAPAAGELAKGLSGADVSKGLANVDVGAALSHVGDAAKLLFERLTEQEFERTLRELLETTMLTKGGQTLPLMPVFDEELAGEVDVVLQLLAFALEVNFSRFLPGLIARAQAGLAMTASLSKASTSKAGPAGGSSLSA